MKRGETGKCCVKLGDLFVEDRHWLSLLVFVWGGGGGRGGGVVIRINI